MRNFQQALNHLIWGAETLGISKEDILICFEDRFVGLREVRVDEFDAPEHRVRFLKVKGIIVWHRATQTDLIGQEIPVNWFSGSKSNFWCYAKRHSLQRYSIASRVLMVSTCRTHFLFIEAESNNLYFHGTLNICGIPLTSSEPDGRSSIPTLDEPVRFCAAGKNLNAAVTVSDKVFVWGAVIPVREIESLRNHDIVKVAVGDNHLLCLSANGIVYSVGNNTSGQLGVRTRCSRPSRHHSEETEVEELSANIFLSGHHSVTLTGMGLDIACTGNTSVVLARALDTERSGETELVHIFGAADPPLLGETDYQSSARPTAIHAPFGTPMAVAAGGSHVGVLTEEGQAFFWGQNSHGECGQSERRSRVINPQTDDMLASDFVGGIGCYENASTVVLTGGPSMNQALAMGVVLKKERDLNFMRRQQSTEASIPLVWAGMFDDCPIMRSPVYTLARGTTERPILLPSVELPLDARIVQAIFGTDEGFLSLSDEEKAIVVRAFFFGMTIEGFEQWDMTVNALKAVHVTRKQAFSMIKHAKKMKSSPCAHNVVVNRIGSFNVPELEELKDLQIGSASKMTFSELFIAETNGSIPLDAVTQLADDPQVSDFLIDIIHTREIIVEDIPVELILQGLQDARYLHIESLTTALSGALEALINFENWAELLVIGQQCPPITDAVLKFVHNNALRCLSTEMWLSNHRGQSVFADLDLDTSIKLTMCFVQNGLRIAPGLVESYVQQFGTDSPSLKPLEFAGRDIPEI